MLIRHSIFVKHEDVNLRRIPLNKLIGYDEKQLSIQLYKNVSITVLVSTSTQTIQTGQNVSTNNDGISLEN